jgi:hypothetical protein
MKNRNRRIYRILFHNQGGVYEIYARKVSQGTLYAFVEVEEIVFGERSQLLVDPSEEKLKSEFAGVRRIYIPLQAVVRIDEVEKEGAARIRPGGEQSTVTPFPLSAVPPRPRSDKT